MTRPHTFADISDEERVPAASGRGFEGGGGILSTSTATNDILQRSPNAGVHQPHSPSAKHISTIMRARLQMTRQLSDAFNQIFKLKKEK